MSPFHFVRSSRLWLGAALCLFTTLATAQAIQYVKPVATSASKFLYFRDHKMYFVWQRSQTGLSVYRQYGNRRIPMH